MSKLLENQVAIVTGSGRGIGREVALLFAEHGARVVVSDKDDAPALEVVSAIREMGGEATAYCGDITSAGFAESIVDKGISEFGRLDILVNNAGYTSDSLIHKMTDEQFQAMLDIHLIAPFRLIRAATPYMRDAAKKEIEQGIVHHRKIVNVSSGAGVNGNVGQANYSSAKAGVIGLTKTVGKEWAQFNVNTNAVAYGFIDTRLTRPKEEGETVEGGTIGIPGKVRDMFIQKIPQRRPGTAREAAESIFYLASPLSNYVNGQVISINGGL
ncbi:SDR family oxidoreductase [Peribacillus frigoritolerans]|uniref:SDR family NAD(P)-dependent oxidoreductase n=1 Tax=Peribacillus frigoritolerans TaxID=450367 RepID=UPI0020BDBDFE|nr:SDR family NAD(P)-dependent oxidoreductase [Peribacillus frigoritolerans]MCU6598954.1 SDR family oxidoreductase [Peribacillus frigoritolerans]